MKPGWVLCGSLALSCVGPASSWAEPVMQFWNTSTVTIASLQLATPGTDKWGKNQCLNDVDKTVSADERLKITDVTPGHYDVKLSDTRGRSCTVRNVDIKAGGKYAFSIGDEDLTNCSK